MHDSDFYQVGRNGVRDMVTIVDPADPLPKTVFGGVSSTVFISNLEKFTADPSHGGQFFVEPRSRYCLPAWSITSSSDRSLVVNECDVTDVADATAPRDARPFEPEKHPAPEVPVPLLQKYVNLSKVTLADSSTQARGVSSDLTTCNTVNTRIMYKVSLDPRI